MLGVGGVEAQLSLLEGGCGALWHCNILTSHFKGALCFGGGP